MGRSERSISVLRRFSIRAVLVAIFVFAVALAWFVFNYKQACRELDVMVTVSNAGGTMVTHKIAADKLNEAIDKHLFPSVVGVYFAEPRIEIASIIETASGASEVKVLQAPDPLDYPIASNLDNVLGKLSSFPRLRWLIIAGDDRSGYTWTNPRLSAIGLRHLHEMQHLESICISNFLIDKDEADELKAALPNTTINLCD